MSEIQQELEACTEYANFGYKIANKSFLEMKKTLAEEKNKLREAESNQKQDQRLKNIPHFKEQIRETERLENKFLRETENKLNELKNVSEYFSIALYGRTMVGKSTLMEVLTHGDGKTIGGGAQRTTRDIFPYTWNGLKMIDLPGVCSFGGSEDDNLALKAASSADMILFLIGTDGAQADEAQRLSELKKLGKPILGIVNVKQSITSEPGTAKRKIEIKQIEKKMNDTSTIDEHIRQFKDLAKLFGTNFSDIKFVYANFQAEFFSQPERENNVELHRLSNFEEVEKFILEAFYEKGKFFRFKNFVEAVSRPMQFSIATLYEQSARTVNQWLLCRDSINKLDEWYGDKNSGFVKKIQSRFDNFISDLRSQFNKEINSFVDVYYDRSDANEAWRRYVNDMQIEKQCRDFITSVANEAENFLKKLNHNLSNGLKHFKMGNISTPTLYLSDLTDYGDGLRTIAPLIALVNLPAAIVVGLVSFLFESRSAKIEKQKENMRRPLRENRDKIIDSISNGVVKILNEQIHGNLIWGFRKQLFEMCNMLKQLSYAQNVSADVINHQYERLNYILLCEGINYAGGDSNELEEVTVARIVSEETLVFSTTASFLTFGFRRKISDLIGEHISFVQVDDDNYFGDILDFLRKNIVRYNFSFDMFVETENENDDMYIVYLPKKNNFSEIQVQLTQQLCNDPVVFY